MSMEQKTSKFSIHRQIELMFFVIQSWSRIFTWVGFQSHFSSRCFLFENNINSSFHKRSTFHVYFHLNLRSILV